MFLTRLFYPQAHLLGAEDPDGEAAAAGIRIANGGIPDSRDRLRRYHARAISPQP